MSYRCSAPLQALAGLCALCVFCGATMTRPEGARALEEEAGASGPAQEHQRGLLALVLGPGLARSPLLSSFLCVALSDSFATLALFLPFLFLPDLAASAGIEKEKVEKLLHLKIRLAECAYLLLFRRQS